MSEKDKAVLFVDGNNWYHSLKLTGIKGPMALDCRRVSEKLVTEARNWVQTRYYIGALPKKDWNAEEYANQRRFLSLAKNDDPQRIQVFTRPMSEMSIENPLAERLLRILENKTIEISSKDRQGLQGIIRESLKVETFKEKGVDVRLAIDMVDLAREDAFDTAYLLSADGDFVPAVKAVKAREKKVFVASPSQCGALAQVADTYIRLRAEWFDDCYRAKG